MEMSSINVLKRALLREDIRDHILDAILTQELRPGERIVETRWAKSLGVSQAPVREAIRELEAMGVAENKPYQGSFVHGLSPKEMRDAYEVRLALELQALPACLGVLSDEDLDHMEQLAAQMTEAAMAKELRAFQNADVRFHSMVVEAADNAMLYRLWQQCKMAEWAHLAERLRYVDSVNIAHGHFDIVEALRTRDENLSAAAVSSHIRDIIDKLKD